MKSRHRKNKSLLNEHSRSNPYAHHRSFSYNRYPPTLRSNHLPPAPAPLPAPELLISDSITLPLSTDYNREARTAKKNSKEGSQRLQKEKKLIKSKDKESNQRKPKEKSKPMREKASNERGDKSDRKGSKELIRNKDKVIADISSERRGKDS